MKFNPSLTARLRIGFLILFTLLLAVSLLGVGRLFQIRVDFEDETSRYFQLELETERLHSSFILEQAAVRLPAPDTAPDAAEFERAVEEFEQASERAAELAAGNQPLTGRLNRLVENEAAWREVVAAPRLRGRAPPPGAEERLTTRVTASAEGLTLATRGARDGVRENARQDTRDTTILVAVGLAGALFAALILFSGLINSMRAPLARLVDGARRLAGGDLETRVEVGGPVEIATLGQAFNEMATSLERDARERDRVERMKDDFVLTVSHELRTPVTVVKGFAEMLTAQPKGLNARQMEAAEIIADSAGQLQKMINDLLDLARSDAGKLRIVPEPTPVRGLVQRVGRHMRPHFEDKGQKLTVTVEKELPDVEADPDRISQVLSNLLTNANKYAPEGAHVRVSAGQVGKQVEFVVADDGPGLEAEQIDHVFERFWRGLAGETQEIGGTGLGLAIAKSLVELHGGAISATSKPGEGATFRFVLPIAKDSKKAPTADSGNGRKAATKARA
jgi:signal transduction histidine kinase